MHSLFTPGLTPKHVYVILSGKCSSLSATLWLMRHHRLQDHVCSSYTMSQEGLGEPALRTIPEPPNCTRVGTGAVFRPTR